jgi:cell wall-associated NlpC family hydrolase
MTRFQAYRTLPFVLAALAASTLPHTACAEVLPPPHGVAAVETIAPQTQAVQATQAVQPTPEVHKSAFGRIADFTNHASQLAVQAVSMLGTHYKYGGTSPENGMDCSGLVRYVFKEAWGADLPRTAAEISHTGQHVDPQDLKPGDLVFFNTMRRGFSHVGIYMGDNKFIHSPSSGGKVRIESMDLAYWKHRFNGARRMDDPGQTSAQ